MSIDPTIAVLYAQTGYTARVVHEAATAPQTSVAMARVLADEMLRHEQQQVQRTEKGDEARVASDSGRDPGQMPFGSRRRQRNPKPPPEEEQPRGSEGPLIGNLLNLKV